MKLEKKRLPMRELEEDMINQLPDSLLCEILFNLPTKDVIKTSVLCRRWRDLWQSVPGLDLEFHGYGDSARHDFVNRFIDLNSGLCVQRVKLEYVADHYDSRVEKSIDTLIKPNIQHLDIVGTYNSMYKGVEIPPTIYTSCERLVSLKLYGASLPKPPDSVSLPCLKIMDLRRMAVFDKLAMEMLISLCPALETLTMDSMYGVKVSSRSLLSFCLNKYEGLNQIAQVVMQTPRLKYLKLNRHFIEKIIVNDSSSIVKLNLDGLIKFDESYPHFLTLISRVKDLTISSDILQVNRRFLKSESSLFQFHNLSNLSVKDMTKDMKVGTWEYLLMFLERCPNLKSLVMEYQDHHYGINFFLVPQCVLSSLEFVQVKARYLADMEKIGSYFLEKSTVLKKFTLCLDQIKEKDYVILDELFALPRRSSACEVVVRSGTFGTYNPLSRAGGFSM